MNYSDWITEIDREERSHKAFRNRATKVKDIYRLKDKRDTRFNILWSNTDVLHGAIYSQTAKPDVRRRFKDDNPVARKVSELLEKALGFCVDSYDFDAVIDPAVDDYLVPGLGQVRVHYKPYFEAQERRRDDLEAVYDEEKGNSYLLDGEPVEPEYENGLPYVMQPIGEEIVYQELFTSVVPWDQFLWSVSQDWDSVWWVGEVHYLTKDELENLFVLSADDDIPLEYTDSKKSVEQGDKTKAKVYEIWDKDRRKHFGLIRGLPRLLKFKVGDETAADDPLELTDFWPYPRPLLANNSSGTVEPIPDYAYYQDQAEEMHELSRRIEKLTEQLKYRGAYDASFPELQDIATGSDGTFQPIDAFAERFKGQGLDTVLATMPLEEIQRTVVALMAARDEVKQSIYEITGISDIVRGSTVASETLGAQQLKGQFANMRLSKKQASVAKFVRDIFRIKAEILAEHFEPEVLTLMTGVEVTPEMQALMKSDVLREFSIDVESDSTVLTDQAEDQKNRTEAIDALASVIERVLPLGLPPEVVIELAKFTLGGFKEGRKLEEIIDNYLRSPGPEVNPMGGGGVGVPVPPGDNQNVSPIQGSAGNSGGPVS